MASIGTLEARLTAENKQLKATLAQSEVALRDYERNAKSAATGAERAFSSAGSKIAASLGGVVSAMAAFRVGMDVVRTGAQFQQTMAKVGGVTNATEKQFQDLTRIARKMGEETEFSANQAAEGLSFLGMAGFGVEKSIAALPGVLNLATAGGIDLGRAADIASNALSAMRLPVEELDRVNDVFAQTITTSNTNMEMLAESFKYAAPLAAGFGIEIEEVSGLIGLLGNAGIQGSMAGTQLAFAMNNLDKAFEVMEVSSTRADGSMKGLVDVLEEMEKQGMTTQQIMDIFGQRAGRAMLALSGVGVNEVKKYVTSMENARGSTTRLANTMRDTLVGDLKILNSTYESLKIDAFSEQNEDLRKTIQELTQVLRDNREAIIGFFNALVSIGTGVINTLTTTIQLIQNITKELAHSIYGADTFEGIVKDIQTEISQLNMLIAEQESLVDGGSIALINAYQKEVDELEEKLRRLGVTGAEAKKNLPTPSSTGTTTTRSTVVTSAAPAFAGQDENLQSRINQAQIEADLFVAQQQAIETAALQRLEKEEEKAKEAFDEKIRLAQIEQQEHQKQQDMMEQATLTRLQREKEAEELLAQQKTQAFITANNAVMTGTNALVSMFAANNKKMQKENKDLNTALTIANTAAMAIAAGRDTPGPWYVRAAAVAAAIATGAEQLSVIRRSDSGGGLSTGGGGGVSPSTLNSLQEDTATQNQGNSQQQITIQVDGDVVDLDEWMEKKGGPAIRRAVEAGQNLGIQPIDQTANAGA